MAKQDLKSSLTHFGLPVEAAFRNPASESMKPSDQHTGIQISSATPPCTTRIVDASDLGEPLKVQMLHPPPGVHLANDYMTYVKPKLFTHYVPSGDAPECPATPVWLEHTSEEELSTTDDEVSNYPSADRCPGLGHLLAKANPRVGQEKTTLMIRNVPIMYTQAMLLEEWSQCGDFDFLYMPRSAGGVSNLSYAFINFSTESGAVAFKDQWNKKRLAYFTARKPLNISFAETQGLQANLKQLSKKRPRCIEMRQCSPIIFIEGKSASLTEALAALH
mmetsp:Transcript_41644/g.89406  ORF Transcript_41644/g.89406 Transcript_41644/m.89406 type:complete len:276 (+) Transcript_41644:51-878(+)